MRCKVLCFLVVLKWIQVTPKSWETKCPDKCKCEVVTSPYLSINLKNVDCSFGDLREIPEDLPKDVESLVLQGNSLSSLHDTLSELVDLKELDLSRNKVKSLGRNFLFQNLTRLKYLSLANNELSILFNDAFQGLQYLEHLVLAKNRLNYIEDSAFSGLRMLRTLDMELNMIGSLYEDWFLGLDTLNTLNLAHNRIHRINQEIFTGLSSLQRLSLGGNRISSVDSMGFSHLVSLNYLYMENNLLSDVPSDAIQKLPKVQILRLDSNPIVRLRSFDFFSLNVTELSLDTMPELQVIEAKAFCNLPKLTMLHLHDNPVLAHIDPSAFINVPSLQTLYLHNNRLGALNMLVKSHLPLNTEVSFYGNPLICDCNIRWIKQEIEKSLNASVKFMDVDQMTCDQPQSKKYKLVRSLKLSQLDKQCKPVIINFLSNGTLDMKLGDSLSLECRAEGILFPTTHWLLPNGSVMNQTTNTVRVRLTSTGTLIFYHLKAEDAGLYVCVAENSIGSSRVNISLHVAGIDINLFPSGVSSTFVTLVWNGTARNAFPVYYILYQECDEAGREVAEVKQRQVSVSSFRRSHTINDLSPDTLYRFCIAFQDGRGNFVRISCTIVKTQNADFMLQGIQRTSSVTLATILTIVVMSLTIMCIATLILRKYHHRLYENPEKCGIQMDTLYSPLVNSVGS